MYLRKLTTSLLVGREAVLRALLVRRKNLASIKKPDTCGATCLLPAILLHWHRHWCFLWVVNFLGFYIMSVVRRHRVSISFSSSHLSLISSFLFDIGIIILELNRHHSCWPFRLVLILENVNVFYSVLLVWGHLHKCFSWFPLNLISIYYKIFYVPLDRRFRYLVIIRLIILVYFALDQTQIRLHVYGRFH